MARIGLTLAVAGLLGVGCATSASQSGASPTAVPAQATEGSQANSSESAEQREQAKRSVDPDEHYERVMKRARSKGIQVIWVHPPTKHAAASHVSPPRPDQE